MFLWCLKGETETYEDLRPRRMKMVVVGDGECGKTCLLHRFTDDEFYSFYRPTVFETQVETVSYKDQEVELVMYDTAGQEDYDRLRPFSYSDTDVIVICFSVDSPDSLENVRLRWLPEVRYFCGNVPVLLVANKADLRDPDSTHHQLPPIDISLGYDSVYQNLTDFADKPYYCSSVPAKLIEPDTALAVSKEIGAVGYFETSALTGSGVDSVFRAVIRAGMELPKEKKKLGGLFRRKKSR